MERKLVKQGNSALTITVPAKWIQKKRLSPGDTIQIEEKDGDLAVTTKSIPKKREVQISLKEKEETIVRMQLNNIYRLGYDLVNVDYFGDKQKKIIEGLVNETLLGFEIIERKENRIIIENLTEPSGDKQEAILKKIFYTISESFTSLKGAMAGDKQEIKELQRMTKKVSEYDNFYRRNIAKYQKGRNRSSIQWSLATRLLLLQRNIYHLSDKTKEISPKIYSPQIKRVKESFDQIFSAYLRKDINKLNKLHEELNKHINNDLTTKLKSSKGEVTLYYHFLLQLVIKTSFLTANMTALLV
jgi:phosphate uptake regulator